MNSTPISDISVELICAENVPVVWTIIRDRLERAIARQPSPEYGVLDLFDSLVCRKAQLWIVNDRDFNIRLICITRVLSYPKKRTLLIDFVEGEDLVASLALLEKSEAWMKAHGCSEIEAVVQAPLARLLERKGAFKRSRVILYRELQDVDLSETSRKME